MRGVGIRGAGLLPPTLRGRCPQSHGGQEQQAQAFAPPVGQEVVAWNKSGSEKKVGTTAPVGGCKGIALKFLRRFRAWLNGLWTSLIRSGKGPGPGDGGNTCWRSGNRRDKFLPPGQKGDDREGGWHGE